jgi:hypothetical protein
MSNDEAFDEGYHAYWDGRTIEENPHEPETAEFGRWEAGWITARNHDYDESDS